MLVCAFALLGCAPRPILAASAADLAPDALPGERATLRLGGAVKGYAAIEMEVALARASDRGDVTLKLLANGEAVERETYAPSPEAFRAIAVADQTFQPSVDLVRFPARAGDGWDWSGRVVYAGTAREATARVTLSSDGGDLQSGVALSVEGMPRQSLAFWFRKGRGIVRRRFGDVSARRPVGEPWRP